MNNTAVRENFRGEFFFQVGIHSKLGAYCT
jgi:hypothetical protein